jgi:hypothetical protein
MTGPKVGPLSALVTVLSRRPPQCSPKPRFLFFVATQTFYGCMRPFQLTTPASWSRLSPKRVRLGDLTISLFDSGDRHSKTA